MDSDEDAKGRAANPLLTMALGMFDSVVPGALTDPEKALRELAPRLRYLVIGRVEKPSVPQLEAIRTLDPEQNLVQIRKALQAGDLEYGPFISELAEETLLPGLASAGLRVSLRGLTEKEQAAHFEQGVHCGER